MGEQREGGGREMDENRKSKGKINKKMILQKDKKKDNPLARLSEDLGNRTHTTNITDEGECRCRSWS